MQQTLVNIYSKGFVKETITRSFHVSLARAFHNKKGDMKRLRVWYYTERNDVPSRSAWIHAESWEKFGTWIRSRQTNILGDKSVLSAPLPKLSGFGGRKSWPSLARSAGDLEGDLPHEFNQNCFFGWKFRQKSCLSLSTKRWWRGGGQSRPSQDPIESTANANWPKITLL